MVEKTTSKPTAADAKPDPRTPDTEADKSPNTPAGWQGGDDAARLAGFHTIEGHDHAEGPGAGEPVRMPAQNAANSTFAERKAARLKQGDTTVDAGATDTK